MQQETGHNQTYTAADIERYHQGGMPAEEMHRLEKAALDDPFLADALDGYALTATPAADAAYLRQQLDERTRKEQKQAGRLVYPLFRAAALVIVLAGLGWLIYYLSGTGNRTVAHTDTRRQPAENNAGGNREKTDTTPPAVPYNGKATAGSTMDQPLSLKSATGAAAEDEQRRVQNETAAATTRAATKDAEQRMTKTDIPAAAPAAPVAAAPDLRTARAATIDKASFSTFRGRVVDTNNRAIPFASVSSRKAMTSTTTDANGNFVLVAPDSTIDIAINSVGFESGTTSLQQQKAEHRIVLQPASGALSEVVVTGHGQAKKRAATIPRITLEAAEPTEGMTAYNQYVAENLRAPEELQANPVKGRVQLSFEVDEKGSPVDIRVEKSLCQPCDAEARRILQEGPKFRKTGKRKRATASIRF